HLDRLDLKPYQNDFSCFMQEVKNSHIEHLLCIAIDLESYPAMLDLVADYPQISVSVGVHPNVDEGEEPSVDKLTALGANDKVIAIGETGLDYFRSSGDLSWQHRHFRNHIQAAKVLKKPLIIHTREAKEDTLRILQEEAMKGSISALQVQVPVNVATFLLNEKRSDIHRIESRLKVGITLIPNPHIETPNYTINRVKHDDVTTDAVASYNLVEKPVESAQGNAAQAQQKATRAQAAVKSITPAQPAPIKAAEAKASFISKIVAWFKQPETAVVKVRPSNDKPRANARLERGERSERGGDNKRRERVQQNAQAGVEKGDKNTAEQNNARRERNKPTQNSAKAAEVREPKPAREPREARPPKASRPPREDKAEIITAIFTPPILNDVGEETAAREGSRRRGRRGGRNRRDNVVKSEISNTAVNEQLTAPTHNVFPSEYIAMPSNMVAPSEYVAMPTPAAVVLTQIETKAAPAKNFNPPHAAGGAPRRRERQREIYVETVKLEQVETKSDAA
ncbi:MAG: TatD family hydrolase, partial [Gallionella sp.]